ncbi:hypothetical protein FSHL1_005214 [Fusarium sambucinum]
MCKDEDIQKSVSDCVSRACTLREGIEFQNSVSSICNVPTADNRGMYRDIIIVFATFSFTFVVLRVVSKLIAKTPWGPDDTWAIIAFVVMVPTTAFMLLVIKNGFGSLESIYRNGNGNLTHLFKYIFIWQILSILGLAAAKTSILFFYLRIFPDEKFRIIVWMTIAFNVVSTIVTLVLNLTLGQAVRIIWGGGTDYNSSLKTYSVVFKVGLANNAVSFALDIWMLFLPMTQLYNLGLRQRQKIKVMSMFGMGVFLTIVSLVRLVIQSKVLPNPSTSDGSAHAIVILGNVELYVGVMVACGPSVNQLVQYILPRIRQPIGDSSQASDRPVFVDRSLAQIEKDEDAPTLYTDGGLTITTMCSTIRDTA